MPSNLLRITTDQEEEGLDISQHGNTAYPELVTAGTAPHAMSSGAESGPALTGGMASAK